MEYGRCDIRVLDESWNVVETITNEDLRPVNLPCMRSPEDGFSGLIFERMTDIEERFAGNGDDSRISDVQLLG